MYVHIVCFMLFVWLFMYVFTCASFESPRGQSLKIVFICSMIRWTRCPGCISSLFAIALLRQWPSARHLRCICFVLCKNCCMLGSMSPTPIEFVPVSFFILWLVAYLYGISVFFVKISVTCLSSFLWFFVPQGWNFLRKCR